MRCEIDAGQGEVSSRNCELEYFSCEVGPGRGEGSSFPDERGAVCCGLADVSGESSFVHGENGIAPIANRVVVDRRIWYRFGHEHCPARTGDSAEHGERGAFVRGDADEVAFD